MDVFCDRLGAVMGVGGVVCSVCGRRFQYLSICETPLAINTRIHLTQVMHHGLKELPCLTLPILGI
jgi:hypothetical protein